MYTALVGSRRRSFVRQAIATLASDGIDTVCVAADERRVELRVLEQHLDRAVTLLSEQLAEELAERRLRGRARSRTPLALQPAFAAAAGMAVALIAVYAVTGGADAATPLFQRAALHAKSLLNGEWWRVVTAATLHADMEHVAGNASFLLLLGWAAAERVGAGVMPLAWLLTAAIGFVASVFLGDVSWTVGASGGLFGLLGLAGGHALRWRALRTSGALGRLRGLAGAVLLLAMTAFRPQSNLWAHLVGFAVGAVFGSVMPRRAAPPWIQVLAATSCGVTVIAAWLVSQYHGPP